MDISRARYVDAAPFSSPPAGRCLPRTRLVLEHLESRFHLAEDLGCYVNRAKTGGSEPSVHRDGRAFDLGFLQDEDARQECFEWLVAHAGRLAVQMVLNYKRRGSPSSGIYWRLPRYEDELDPEIGVWSTVGHWLHVEIHPSEALDETPIYELLGEDPIPPAPPVPPTKKEIVVNVTVEQIRRGDRGGFVKKAQAILTANFGQQIGPADGIFGSRTDAGVRAVQKFFGLVEDGIVGPKTWTILLEIAP